MKPLLILSWCFLCIGVRAQQVNKDSLVKVLQEKLKWNNNQMVFKYDSRLPKTHPSNRDSSGRLLPGIHRLPQDGMMCYVPDTKDIAALPNVYKGKVAVPFTSPRPRIPNPLPTEPLPFQYKQSGPVLPKK